MDDDADFPLTRRQAEDIRRVALQFLVEFDEIARVAVGGIAFDADVPRLIGTFRRYDAGAPIGSSLAGCSWHRERTREICRFARIAKLAQSPRLGPQPASAPRALRPC